MARLDLTERKLKIEHIEGFLYGIQEVENLIRSSQGACYEYAILEMDNFSKKSDLELVVENILDRIKFSSQITPQIKSNFTSNIEEQTLDNWKVELAKILHKWFIDKHLSSKSVKIGAIEYMNRFDNWTEEQKLNFTNRYQDTERRVEQRINKTKITAKTCIEMIEAFMNKEFELIRYDFQKVKHQKNLYPYHSMNLYWGMEFDLLLLSNSEKKVLLHFGKLLN